MNEQKKWLIKTLQPYTNENRLRSWWHVCSTFLLLVSCAFLTYFAHNWLLICLFTLLNSLLLLRLSILFHDYQHGAILRRSNIAKGFMTLLGIIVLAPASIWNRNHNYHHTHNGRVFGPSIGAYPLLTTQAYQKLSRKQQFHYRLLRHPVTIFLGYFTVFYGIFLIKPLLNKPKNHLDCLAAILLHFFLIITFWIISPKILLCIILIPAIVSGGIASYLFYAQHNFPNAQYRLNKKNDFVFAALHSSSFMDSWKITHWFTANIGYHHIHHLNPKIPFYRLPEAMHAINALQRPGKTSLNPCDIMRCLKLKLWDDEKKNLVGI